MDERFVQFQLNRVKFNETVEGTHESRQVNQPRP